jgi:hypothetical protein
MPSTQSAVNNHEYCSVPVTALIEQPAISSGIIAYRRYSQDWRRRGRIHFEVVPRVFRRRGSFEHVETPSRLKRLLRKIGTESTQRRIMAPRCPLVDDKAVVPLPRTFYQQLLFSPLTINNFWRHPCHEVIVITVNF